MFFIYSLAPRASPSDNSESEDFTCEQGYIILGLCYSYMSKTEPFEST